MTSCLSAEPSTTYAAPISKSSQVGSHAVPDVLSEDGHPHTGTSLTCTDIIMKKGSRVVSCPGPAEAGEHTVDRRNHRHSAASDFETPPPPYKSGTAGTVKIKSDFLQVAHILQRCDMDCFESIRYKGKEVPRLPVFKDLFTFIDRLAMWMERIDSKFHMEDLPLLEWTPYLERCTEVHLEVCPEELTESEGSDVVLARMGMFRHAVNEYSTDFCSLHDQASQVLLTLMTTMRRIRIGLYLVLTVLNHCQMRRIFVKMKERKRLELRYVRESINLTVST